MNTFTNVKNLSILINITIFILLLFVAFCKGGELTTINNQLSFLTDKVNSVENMQMELRQKDTLIYKIQNENNQIRNYLLREYEIQTIKLNEREADFKELEQKLNEIGVNLNNLNSSISVSFQKIDSSVIKLIGVGGQEINFDSLNTPLYSNYSFNDSSEHLILNGDLNLLDGELSYKYKYKANFDLVTYTEGKSVFGQRKMFGTLICDDPFAEVGLKSIMIKQRRPTFHIGLGFGGSLYYNNAFKLAPSINVSLYKPIIDIYL